MTAALITLSSYGLFAPGGLGISTTTTTNLVTSSMSVSDWWAIPTFVVGLATLAVTGLQFWKAFVRSVKVRHVFASEVIDRHTGPSLSDRQLVIDVVSRGAAITDMQVHVEMFKPAEFDTNGNQTASSLTMVLELDPTSDTSSVAAGQGVRFQIRKSQLCNVAHGVENFNRCSELAARVPPWCISVAVTGAGKRDTLKRLRSKQVNVAVYHFYGRFESSSPLKFPLRSRLQGYLTEFMRSSRGRRIRHWVEKRRPGLFDMTYKKLDRLLSTHELR